MSHEKVKNNRIWNPIAELQRLWKLQEEGKVSELSFIFSNSCIRGRLATMPENGTEVVEIYIFQKNRKFSHITTRLPIEHFKFSIPTYQTEDIIEKTGENHLQTNNISSRVDNILSQIDLEELLCGNGHILWPGDNLNTKESDDNYLGDY